MKAIKTFTGKYQKQLTLRNELIPIGKTLDNLMKNGVIKTDKDLEAKYQNAKQIIDNYHRFFIDKTLSGIDLYWDELANAIYEIQKERNDDTVTKLDKAQATYRKLLTEEFSSDEDFKYLFKKELFSKLLPAFCTNDQDLETITAFKNFFTYFTGFNDNRKNIYSSEPISTSIAYRIVHENFPKFIANCETFKTLQKLCPNIIEQAEASFKKANILNTNTTLQDYFSINNFNTLLTQNAIQDFNYIIGGTYAEAGSQKLQGINELINIAMQQDEQLRQALRSKHATKMYSLYKQILAQDASGEPFIDTFENDAQVQQSLRSFYNSILCENGLLSKVNALFKHLNEYSLDKIYVSGKKLTALSQIIYGGAEWSKLKNIIHDLLQKQEEHKKALKNKDYDLIDKKINADFYSLSFLQQNADENLICDFVSAFVKQHELLINALSKDLSADTFSKTESKAQLDLLLDYCHLVSIFEVTESIEKDSAFYGVYEDALASIKECFYIYNKVRNYATKKPFNEEKFKLNFNNAQLAGGWDANKETDYASIILIKDNNYYLGIMNKNNKPNIKSAITDNDINVYSKMVYKYFPDFSKMFIKCAMVKEVKQHFTHSSEPYILKTSSFIKPLYITKEIYDLYSKEYDGKKKFQIDYLRKTNDTAGYYDALNKWQKFAINFIKAYSSTSIYDITQIEKTTYERLDKFYKDLDNTFYNISFEKLDAAQVNKWIDDGQLYLFKIYNKDFAAGRTGTKNLHTLYWESIFDAQNLQNTVVKLNGGAELFYRKKTKGSAITHKQGSKLVNRIAADGTTLPNDIYQNIYLYVNGKAAKLSDKALPYYDKAVIKTATHDIIKDKRYYEDKFFFHCPITINYKSPDRAANFNQEVLEYLKNNPDINIIGIDRGERNLIYITVINQQGEIILSKSFNTLTQKSGNILKSINYHDKLHQREFERTEARKSWETIGKIATLKEGYLSAVIHEIAKLMVEYNAIIVMEDLNAGFKRMRGGIAEKAIYQKFEKMLIDKLNYLSFKNLPNGQPGGILQGYQLATKFESFEKIGKQNGFIFYVPAAFTSKIDPTTGFSSIFNFKHYNTKMKRKEFFASFDSIIFDASKKLFTFAFDYSKFKTYATFYKTKWQISSYGERILHKKQNNAHYEYITVDPTADLLSLFKDHHINIDDNLNILPQILEIEDSNTIWDSLFYSFKNILQMRNSSHQLNEAGQEIDYIISPVFNGTNYYDSRTAAISLPQDADANGAYHIALKGLLYLQINNAAQNNKPKFFIKNEDWFKFTQTRS